MTEAYKGNALKTWSCNASMSALFLSWLNDISRELWCLSWKAM